MLRVSGISAYYGRLAAIHDVSFEVNDGDIVCLIGANGAGKSTTLMAISGIVPPAAGSITFDDVRIDGLKPHRIARMGVIQVPEGRRIFPDLSVGENLEMGTVSRREDAGWREDLERVYTLFPRLAERRRQMGSTLSGGEQQMLAIGRALMARPRLLLLDEPSLGLAPMMVGRIYETIAEIRRQGITILLVEQNAHIAWSFASHAYVLENGTVTLAGKPKDLLADARVREAYLGIDAQSNSDMAMEALKTGSKTS